MVGDYLSSDRAFDEFLRTRSSLKVRLEDPVRWRLPSTEVNRRVYEEETERLRTRLHPEPKSHRVGRPAALEWRDPEVADRIFELHRVGHSREEMSRQLGVTRNALERATRELGLSGSVPRTKTREGK